jgi:hypothetical protein
MKKIKLLMSALFMGFLSSSIVAQELPQPSPAASFTQRMGVTDITVKYSRPSVKGRVIWGELVPYSSPWRAGANASTKISFSTDVTINGTTVPAGEYAIYIIPTEKEFTFIISKYVDGWGLGDYTEASDVVRVNCPVNASDHTESLMYYMDALTDNSAMFYLEWEKIKTGFAIEANTAEFAKVIVEKTVQEADNSFRAYNNAANWYLNNGEPAKALDMAKKSTAMDKRFWNLTILSEAYFANGDSKMAISTAKEALALSEEAKYQAYIDRNANKIAEWSKKK